MSTGARTGLGLSSPRVRGYSSCLPSQPRESPVGTKWQSDQRWKLRWVETRNEIPDIINIAGMG